MIYTVQTVISYNRSIIQYKIVTIIVTGKKAKIHNGNSNSL